MFGHEEKLEMCKWTSTSFFLDLLIKGITLYLWRGETFV